MFSSGVNSICFRGIQFYIKTVSEGEEEGEFIPLECFWPPMKKFINRKRIIR
jgi:hypothetical protein